MPPKLLRSKRVLDGKVITTTGQENDVSDVDI